MSKGKELVKNTAIITIGKLCTQFLGFFLLPLYTSYLSTQEYGIVDLCSTYIQILLPIVFFQIDQSLFRYLVDSRDNSNQSETIISTSIFFAIIQTSIFVIIFIIAQFYFNNIYIWIIFGNLIGCIFSNTMLQIARGFGENKIYSFGSFLSAVTCIVFNIIFIVVYRLGANGMLMATFIGYIVCGVYIIFRMKIYKKIHFRAFKYSILKQLLNYSIPLIPNSLSWWAIGASDRMIFALFLPISSIGIVSISQKFSSVYISLFNIFNLSWTESASLHINDSENNIYFTQVVSTVYRLFFSMAILIIGIIPFIFKYMVNKSYEEAYNQIPLYMIASIFNIILGLYSAFYVALKKTKEMAKSAILAGIINIVSNIFFIKFIGIYASSLSSILAYAIVAIYRYYNIKKYINIILPKKVLIQDTVVLLVVCISYYKNNIFINIANFILIFVYCFVVNKNLINILFQMASKKFYNTKL